MGDRGGTATQDVPGKARANYTRWEIGGEPQLGYVGKGDNPIIIPDGRSGGNRNTRLCTGGSKPLYPMGDRGGTATALPTGVRRRVLYPMGDRGGTATRDSPASCHLHYTRWEIGGEPQRQASR